MFKWFSRCLIIAIVLGCGRIAFCAGGTFKFADIPRIDVHAHIGGPENMPKFVKLREDIKEQLGVDMAMWIDLSFPVEPDGNWRGAY